MGRPWTYTAGVSAKGTPALAIMMGLMAGLLLMQTVELAAKSPVPPTPETLEAGAQVYARRCGFCHGDAGGGDGPVAAHVHPRPRDFRQAVFKLRTTRSGELPTDEDLFRTVSQGLPGTAMPAWEGVLSDVERWQVIQFLKTFAEENPFADEELDPYKQLVPLAQDIPVTPESIAQGKAIYQKAKCWECHGQEGRGDGPSARQLKDDWKVPIFPANLTKPWRFKGGTTRREIYLRMTTGLNGTPMPSFADSLTDEERWHLVNYLSSLLRPEAREEVAIRSKSLSAELPSDPDDPRWLQAPAIDVPLSGQVLAKPRWQNHAVDLITVRSLYNAEEVAFWLEWDDRFKDTIHQPRDTSTADLSDTYGRLYTDGGLFDPDLPEPEQLRDAVAIQFPVNIPEGPVKPHFFRGHAGMSVNLWIWQADRNEDPTMSPVVEANQAGFKSPLTMQPPESQQATGRGRWKDGQWRVVIRRALRTADPSQDIQFARGVLIPMAVNVWDGSNGEKEFKMALSSWMYVILEAPTPMLPYLLGGIGLLIVAGLEAWVIRWLRGRPLPSPALQPRPVPDLANPS